jgi:ubiquinone/menaquinone biosynthesis C-methylase UbiE
MTNRKERLEEEFELGEEGEAIHEYEALTDDYLHINACLIADEVARTAQSCTGVAVDLGTGPGTLVRELTIRLSQLFIIGLDISVSMTKLARDRAVTEGMKNVAFVVADVHHLPFHPGSVALIVSHGAMHHWHRLNVALVEIKQALAEKGVVYLSDLKRDAPDDVVQHITSLLNVKQARAFVNSVRAAYTVGELAQLAVEAGLNHMTVEPEEFSRRTIVRNIEKLRGTPMKGIRQTSVNLRLVGIKTG